MAEKSPPPFPSKQDVLDFIKSSTGKITKREIARAFHIRGPDKVYLKKLLREMADDGMIARDDVGRALRPADSLPGVMMVEVNKLDRDGHPLARPTQWDEEDAPPLIRVLDDKKRRGPAIGIGERALVRLHQVSSDPAIYEARIMKRMRGVAEDRILGIFKGGVNGGRIHPVDKRNRDEYWIQAEDVAGAEDGELVLFTVKQTRGRGRGGMKSADIKERLGDVSAPRSISLIAIHAHGIPVDFPTEVEDQAEKATAPSLAGRTDLRSVPLITIDPADARDHDDAIFAEPDTDPNNKGGWHTIVAIADVAAYVTPGSPLDREAKKRGNSCYFPDRVVPMLPEALSAGLCSLQPGEERAALACHMWFDVQGKKLRHQFERVLMKSHANINYERAQAALDGQPDDETSDLLEPVLKPLYGAWEALSAARDRREPLDLDLPERRVQLDEDGRVAAITLRDRLDTHRIVEDFMINANVAAAEALEEKRIRPMYRVHEEPPMGKIEPLREFLDGLGLNLAKGQVLKPRIFNGILRQVAGAPEEQMVNEVILRSQTQAVYSPDNRGHFGLSLARYAHFTSPIRRYADLLVHRGLIRAYGLGHDGLLDDEMSALEETGHHISQTERRAMTAERESTDRYIAAYLGEREGDEFAGRISGVSKFGMFVTLEPSGGDGLIPISQIGHDFYALDDSGHALVGERHGTTFRIGDQVEVRLMEANPYTGGLRLELIGDPTLPDFKPGRRGPKRTGKRRKMPGTSRPSKRKRG